MTEITLEALLDIGMLEATADPHSTTLRAGFRLGALALDDGLFFEGGNLAGVEGEADKVFASTPAATRCFASKYT